MKRLFIILVAGLSALWSCSLNDYFYAENADDFVTVKDGMLVNDFGTTFNVQNNSTGKQWQIPGQRSYIIFDILDRDLNITLKKIYPTLSPAATERTSEEAELKDPILPIQCFVSGTFLNLTLEYYAQKGSDFEHNFSFEYKWHDNKQKLELVLIHEGNNENPAAMDSDLLETRFQAISLPLKDMAPISTGYTLTFTIDALGQKSSDGAYVIQTAQLLTVDL